MELVATSLGVSKQELKKVGLKPFLYVFGKNCLTENLFDI